MNTSGDHTFCAKCGYLGPSMVEGAVWHSEGSACPYVDANPVSSSGAPTCEGILTALRQLRRAVEEAGYGKKPRIREAMDQATIVLGRGY